MTPDNPRLFGVRTRPHNTRHALAWLTVLLLAAALAWTGGMLAHYGL